MSTTFTKAINLGNSAAAVNFGSGTSLDDGNWTYIIGIKTPTGMGGQISLGKSADLGSVGYGLPLVDTGSAFRSDFTIWRTVGQGIWRANPLLPYDTWTWIALSLVTLTAAVKVYAGAYGGSLADTSAPDIGGGSGAALSDAAYDLTLGVNGAQVANNPLQGFFVGRWNSTLSLATINSYVADMDGVGKASSVLYIKPAAADTSSVPDLSGNGNNGAYSGAVTIVAGPDVAAGGVKPFLLM